MPEQETQIGQHRQEPRQGFWVAVHILRQRLCAGLRPGEGGEDPQVQGREQGLGVPVGRGQVLQVLEVLVGRGGRVEAGSGYVHGCVASVWGPWQRRP